MSVPGDEPWFAPSDDGATPLEPDEAQGLRPSWIATRGDLNKAEHASVIAGRAWAMRQRRRGNVLDVDFLLEVHERLFRDVWRWAGAVRTTEKNIGVGPHHIRPELRKLMDDARVWKVQSTYAPDELVARFHHRLIWIHPFANGNGRHARVMADLLMRELGGPSLTWGAIDPAGARERYIAALRAADAHDIAPLVVFIRS